jgi:hypothetical protein
MFYPQNDQVQQTETDTRPVYSATVVASQTISPEDTTVFIDAVNLHLSRTLPAPMEPILALIPEDLSPADSGGNP